MTNKKYEPEIDFEEIIKSPDRHFGAIYPYFLGIIFILGMIFLYKLDDVSINEAPAFYPIKQTVIPEIEKKAGGLMPAINLDEVRIATPELLAKGKELYTQVCASCHGNAGAGDGVAGAGLNPKPRNLLVADNWTYGTSIDMLYKTLQEGILQNGMAAYEYIAPADRFAIIHYMRSLATHYPEITDEQIKSLATTYKLNENVLVPNQIPVATAINLIDKDYKSKIEIIKSKLAQNDTKQLFVKYFSKSEVVIFNLINSNAMTSNESFTKLLFELGRIYKTNNSILSITKEEINQMYLFVKEINLAKV